MTKTALLAIDVQVNMFDEDFCVHDPEGILARLEELIASARRAGAPVIFVRNNGGPGDPDEPGGPGWQLHPHLDARPQDPIIDKRHDNSFEGTSLGHDLARLGVETVVVAGMQTELCVRATCLGARDRGFQVILVEDGHTTFDSEDRTVVETIGILNDELMTSMRVAPCRDIRF